MLLFTLLGRTPSILLFSLLGLVYLTWLELRREDLQPQIKLWWGLLVLLTHVPGYAAMRIWVAFRRRRDGAPRQAGPA